jgi:hypothetical protein
MTDTDKHSSSSTSDESMAEETSVSDISMTEKERKASEKRKREKTGIPKMPRVKPRTFENGFGIIIPGLPKELANDMISQLNAEMEDRKVTGQAVYPAELIPADKIHIVMSPEERKAHDLAYRESYRKLPRVVLKRLEESSKPSIKFKRKTYNAKKEVKERKKQLAKRRRAILKLIKKKDRNAYKEAEEAADALLAIKKEHDALLALKKEQETQNSVTNNVDGAASVGSN